MTIKRAKDVLACRTPRHRPRRAFNLLHDYALATTSRAHRLTAAVIDASTNATELLSAPRLAHPVGDPHRARNLTQTRSNKPATTSGLTSPCRRTPGIRI
jgi:hypothetical protein